jgi:transcriptional regulator with XRE-family HTH domain
MTQLPEDHDDTAKVVDESSTRPMGRRPADTFAVRLLLARHLNGMTISEAADASGLNDATWSTWEAGRRPRDLVDVCQRIAEGLDIDFNWLLLGGPLAGPRGVPTKRAGRDTWKYRARQERTSPGRPNSRPAADRRPGVPPKPEQRRPVRISRPQAESAVPTPDRTFR